ncbi:hypothetical protein [Actinorugispora endophytica]|uniref:Uncharacterized protein n=1 Tax=Actinorugispora endophytica TaxID=1605990 RepID=A0A4R6UZG7_9ACTN|nr:hypothetical protein [Actinorugispora endophytica]TDQ52982.1 hypothetical protein EV190_10599 [Actinorugispora endophytica]
MTPESDPVRIIADLEPAAARAEAERLHRAGREAVLSRAMSGRPAAARAVRRALPRPFTLIAGVTAAAVLAGGAVYAAVAGPIGLPAGPQSGQAGGEAPPPYADASEFLLANADAMAVADPEEGGYWHVKTREHRPTGVLGAQAYLREPGADAPELAGLDVTVEFTSERWTRIGGDHRILNNLQTDSEVVFASEADRKLWEREGSPELSYAEPVSTEYYGGDQRYGVLGLTAQELFALPGTRGALERELRSVWETAPGEQPFDAFVLDVALDFFESPVRADTRAAFYEVLAGIPDIRMAGETADPLGRKGIALEVAPSADVPLLRRWIIEDGTGVLLAREVHLTDEEGVPEADPMTWTAYEEMGPVPEAGEPVVPVEAWETGS